MQRIEQQVWNLHVYLKLSLQNGHDIVEDFGECKAHVVYSLIYSRAMITQNPNVHQCLKDILNKLPQRISGGFMNTKDRQHIDFINFNLKCTNAYTHAHFPTVVK